MAKKTAHVVAEELLLGDTERETLAQTVNALRSRNALLTALESSRAAQGITKARLAERAGLDASSVRRLLTAKVANPTTDHAFRLLAAANIAVVATLPSGARIILVEPQAIAQSA
jgi:chorismate mutase